jgi:hypothetical protein
MFYKTLKELLRAFTKMISFEDDFEIEVQLLLSTKLS